MFNYFLLLMFISSKIPLPNATDIIFVIKLDLGYYMLRNGIYNTYKTQLIYTILSIEAYLHSWDPHIL